MVNMITIVVGKDEAKLKTSLAEFLRHEGYSISEHHDGAKEVIEVGQGSSNTVFDSLKSKVIELEDALYREKRGELYKAVINVIEKPLIEHALERAEGNQLKAARILGINRNTMRSKIKKLAIDVSNWKC